MGIGVLMLRSIARPQEPFRQHGIKFLWRELRVGLVEYFLDLLAWVQDKLRDIAGPITKL